MYGRCETMAQESLEIRMDMLERRVEILERLPERVGALELQIVRLRDETRAEFSATRAEARAGDEETRRFMQVLHEDVLARIAALAHGLRHEESGEPAAGGHQL
jgi:hypothetical protein